MMYDSRQHDYLGDFVEDGFTPHHKGPQGQEGIKDQCQGRNKGPEGIDEGVLTHVVDLQNKSSKSSSFDARRSIAVPNMLQAGSIPLMFSNANL